MGALEGIAVFVFELEEVITASIKDGLGLCFVIIECIAGDDGAFEIGFLVEFQGHGLFAFAFVFVRFGDLGSKADGYRRSGFVVTQTQAQGTVSDPLSINGQSTWKRRA